MYMFSLLHCDVCSLSNAAGASEVVLLDREPLALSCALISAAACGLPGVATLVPDPLEGGGVQDEAVVISAVAGWGGAAGSTKAVGAPSLRFVRKVIKSMTQILAANRTHSVMK